MNASNECDLVKKRLKMLARVEAHNQAKIRYNQKSLERIENLRSMKQDHSFEVLNSLTTERRIVKIEKRERGKAERIQYEK